MLPPIARRFVAGESPATAIERVREVNDREVGAILNLLGEHYDEPEPAAEDAAAYRRLADDIAAGGFDACISVKPSQLGLDVEESLFRRHLSEVVSHAADRGVFVWIDMEDHTTTDATLDAFEELAREHEGSVGSEGAHGSAGSGSAAIGVCVQANLKRTRDDVERLADVPGKVRFVKGAYDEPGEIAYTDGERIDHSYEELLSYAFENYDGGIAVGSHDPAMIDHATALHEAHGTPFEIQMLMGVREDAQYDLAADYPVYQYIPYGDRWISYFYRRLAERTQNVRFALRAILGR